MLASKGVPGYQNLLLTKFLVMKALKCKVFNNCQVIICRNTMEILFNKTSDGDPDSLNPDQDQGVL